MVVLLLDDHPRFRGGMRCLLSDLESRLKYLEAEGLRGAQALLAAADEWVELVLYGVPDDRETAARLTAGLRALLPDAMLVALTDVDDAALTGCCVDAGAGGVIPKNAPPAQLVAALRAVLEGRVALPPSFIDAAEARRGPRRAEDAIAAALPYDARQTGKAAAPDACDQELLWMALRGLSTARIAERCAIACASVEQRLALAYRWLGAASRLDALVTASVLGLAGKPESKVPHPSS